MTKTYRPANSTMVNLAIDSLIFVSFLAATAPRFTGLAIHEWLGIAFGAAIVTHLLLHWTWIVGITRRFFSKVTWASRVNYLLNVLLFIAMTVIIFTGLMISEVALPLFGVHFERDGLWMNLHRLGSDLSVFLVGLHVALHWRWIVSAMRRVFLAPFTRRPAAQMELAPTTVKEVRR